MNDSFSSDTSATDRVGFDLLAAGRFPPLVEVFLRGRELGLLAPVRFLAADEAPTGDCTEAAPDRSAIAAALASANEEYGHPFARHLAERLADPRTRVVITGQQPGLLGGPLYTLVKAVAAQRWAERIEETGVPATALFWVATEDHDYLEVSRAAVLSSAGVTRVDLGEDREPLVPVGLRALGPGVEAALDEIGRLVPGERYAAWLERLREWYRPEASFGEAFSRLLTGLLGERCPLLVDAQLPELKTAQGPWLRCLVEERERLAAAFVERDRQIAERGLPLQVRPQPGTSPLFLLHQGRRRRIEWREPDRFGLRGEESYQESVDRLLEIIEQEPHRVSPGVRARSAIQDAVFGTCLQILGPGELSYLPQAAPLFSVLGIPAPVVALRPQALVLDRRQRARIADSGLSLGELLSPELDLDAWLARPEETAFLESAATGIDEILRGLQAPALELDPGLERPLEKTAAQVQKALAAFGGRVNTAAARRQQELRESLVALRQFCLPEGHLQERVVASAHFPGKYGDDFVAALFEQMELEPRNLQVVSPQTRPRESPRDRSTDG